VVDPGDEADRILDALRVRELGSVAILVTHGHFDHLGAVAGVARASGSPVYIPSSEAPALSDWTADHLRKGGEHLDLGPFSVDVLAVPGHSEGHLAYLVDGALLSGDVLFAGSVGRTDLPGGDWPTLAATLERLTSTLPPETPVLPGHGEATTLGAEAATNPFLAGIGAGG
jgi:glyoxylase-like metal-dependent hydrolase (beta-lactamase superfamily II)